MATLKQAEEAYKSADPCLRHVIAERFVGGNSGSSEVEAEGVTR